MWICVPSAQKVLLPEVHMAGSSLPGSSLTTPHLSMLSLTTVYKKVTLPVSLHVSVPGSFKFFPRHLLSPDMLYMLVSNIHFKKKINHLPYYPSQTINLKEVGIGLLS